MKFSVAASLAASLAIPAGAFTANGPSRANARDVILLATPGGFTTDYLVKAHEDKLRAVSDIEKQKNAQIQALKDEVEALKGQVGSLATNGAPAAAAAPAVTEMENKEEIAAKLISYQQFMAKYIVESHQQKVEAVRAAELRITQKYEEQLRLLKGSTEKEAAAPAAPAISASTDKAAASDSPSTDLFAQRNAKVAASALAGKSRWGEQESARAAAANPAPAQLPTASASSSAPATGAPPTQATPVPVQAISVPPEVKAADHGLRADGGVGGYTLAERVALGANVVNVGAAAISQAANDATAPAPESPVKSLFAQRNQHVVAAAKAGKSRWGELEVDRAASMVSVLDAPAASNGSVSAAAVPPEVEAADHGLRSDGGVGGPSLAQRINLGAQLLNK